MKNDNWAYKYGPPPEDLSEKDSGWPGTWLLLAFVVTAPLIYFGPELGSVEAWIVDLYRMVDRWMAPVRELVFG